RGVEAVAVEELLHRAAAVVHERLGAGDRDLDAVETALSDARVGGLHRELRAGALAQPVRDREADVVARRRVSVAGIAEPDDELVGLGDTTATEEPAHVPPGRRKRAAVIATGSLSISRLLLPSVYGVPRSGTARSSTVRICGASVPACVSRCSASVTSAVRSRGCSSRRAAGIRSR